MKARAAAFVPFALTLLSAMSMLRAPAEAQQLVLPAVSLALRLEVPDHHAWLVMQHEILTTLQELPRNLVVTVAARAGGSRTLVILAPRFTSTIRGSGGTVVRVSVKGTIPGDRALQMIIPFMQALVESGRDPTEVTIEYGLTALTATLLELKLEDR